MSVEVKKYKCKECNNGTFEIITEISNKGGIYRIMKQCCVCKIRHDLDKIDSYDLVE